jgi:hypothetical protein
MKDRDFYSTQDRSVDEIMNSQVLLIALFEINLRFMGTVFNIFCYLLNTFVLSITK